MFKSSRGGKRGRGPGAAPPPPPAKGELVLPDGSKIEFDGDLTYGNKDAALNPATRAAIEQWEAKRVKNKVEYAYSVDENGNPIWREVKGTKGSVRTPRMMHDTENATFTHIHPRGPGMLGGTFSSADLYNFANFRNKTERAAAKEGTYSISKTAKFDKSGFKSMVATADSNFNKEMRAANRRLTSDYGAGIISYSQFQTEYAKAFNTALVNLHNEYLGGQKKYGYTYTLEKR